MDFIYWVVSRDCNQHCGHCYNDSKPGAPGLTLDEVSACVDNLPDPDDVPVGRVGLSGGEVLVWPELLFHTLKELHAKYKSSPTELTIQTNGDLMDDATLDKLLEHHVKRIAFSGMDNYHLPDTKARQSMLEEMLLKRGFTFIDFTGASPTAPPPPPPTASFWGATEDLWIGPLWPRGRAEKGGLSKAGPQHRFCEHYSGAKNFLNYRERGSKINLQLGDIYPCCPLTCRPLGDLRKSKLTAVLDTCAKHPVWQALNEGNPEKMGESLGISEDFGKQRTEALGNHCLWCDEFFTKYATDLGITGTPTERGAVDLMIRGKRQARKAAELARA